MRPRIRTTHVGSLPRGGALTTALLDAAAGKAVDRAQLDAQIEAAVASVVAKQVAAGLDIVNDGEQPRAGFSIHLTQRMSGFGGTSARRLYQELTQYPGFARYWEWTLRGVPRLSHTQPKAIGPVRYHGESDARADCHRLVRQLASHGEPAGFMTAPSPGIVATTMHDAHYGSHERYVFALARELRKEYLAIAESGLVLQIDAPDLALERVVEFQDRTEAEFLEIVTLHVAALNEAIAGIPVRQIRMHCCWGASERPHSDDIALATILPLICEARVGAISLPFASPRHQHEYAALGKNPLPPDMVLIPGVIDNTTNVIEHPEVVAGRIQAAVAKVGDVERVIAGADCGFATFAGFMRVAEDVAYAKLRVIREGAELASARI